MIANAKPLINITSTSISILETLLVNISLNASDLDDDTLVFTSNLSEFTMLNNAMLWYTNLTSSGAYTSKITVNDSADEDSAIINIEIINARDLDNDGNPDFNETDDDNDGISDENDFLIGNISAINTTIPISIIINGTSNLSKLFNGTFAVNISNGSETIIELNFTFNSSSTLDFGNLTINRTTSGNSAVSIRGVPNLFEYKKIIFLEKINTNVNSVCIKDADAGFDAISGACNLADELLLICDNSPFGQYACLDTGARYKITGLSHSAVKELCRDIDGDGYGTGCSAGSDCNDNDASKTTDCSNTNPAIFSQLNSAGSGVGGGPFFVCNKDWQCSEWSACVNKLQTRQCNFIKVPQHVQENPCPEETKFPATSQTCEAKMEKLKTTAAIPKNIEDKKLLTKQNIAQNLSSNKLESITGQAVKLGPEGFNRGIFIVIMEVAVIVGAYLAIKQIL